MKEVIKVAGVTFNNDNGESRQNILESFGDNTILTVNLVHEDFFNKRNNQHELAIGCYEAITCKQLGYIPRSDINDETKQLKQVIAVTGVYQHTWYCHLCPTAIASDTPAHRTMSASADN